MKLLGLFDFITGIIFLIRLLNLSINESLVALLAFYLLLKGIIFLIGFKDTGSLLDLLAGFILLATISITVSPFILIVATMFLIIKGVISFL